MVNHQKYMLNLSKDQIKKLSKNQNILLKPSNMEGGNIEVYLAPNKLRRMMTAMKKGKGIKIGLTQDELNRTMEGEGFKDLLNKGVKLVKKQVPTVASKLIDKAKPIIKKEISKVLEKHVGKSTADKIGHTLAHGGEKLAKKALKIKEDKPVIVSQPEQPIPEEETEDEQFNPLDMYDAVGGRLRRGTHLSGHNKIIGNDLRGGKVNFKKIVKDVSKGYKKYVKDTPVGDAIRKGLKTGLQAGVSALGAVAPEVMPIAQGALNKYGDTLIQKTGLGVLQSNHSNFLNSFHPAMNPNLPSQGITDIPRIGGSFLPAGRMVGSGIYHRGGSFLPSGGRILSSNPMTPKLPEQGITDVPRDDEGRPIKNYQPSTGFFAGS